MKFSKLSIRNYRSIGGEGLDLLFPESSNIVRIVGPNGCGKSNVLAALGHVLDVYPFRRREISESDFHDIRANDEMCIDLTLREPLLDRDVYQKEYGIAGFRLRVRRRVRGDGKGVLNTEHSCVDASGKVIVKASRIYKKKSAADPDVDNAMFPVLASDQAWKLGDSYFLDPSSLDGFFDRTTGAGPLGRLLERYREDFPGDHNTVQLGADKVTARDALERASKKLAEILRTKLLVGIETKLASRVATYLGAPLTPTSCLLPWAS